MSSYKRPTSGRPTPARRAGSGDRSKKRDEHIMENCRAAYLIVLDDFSDHIRSKDQLCQGKLHWKSQMCF